MLPEKNVEDVEVSIIISTHNRYSELSRTLTSLLDNTSKKINFEIIVVSACSNDATDTKIPMLFPSVKVFPIGDVGWGEANNIGVTKARGSYFFFSGPDMIFSKGWLEDITNKAKTLPFLGSIGNLLKRSYVETGEVITGGSYIKLFGIVQHGIDIDSASSNSLSLSEIVVDAVHYPLIPRDVFFKVGGFDPVYFYACDEMDIGLRINKLGLKNYISTSSMISTDQTKNSQKTIYYWNRSRLRMVFKFTPFYLLPELIFYPVIYILSIAILEYLKGEREFSKRMINIIFWNFGNFRETRNRHNWI
jgi:hypothetical protein